MWVVGFVFTALVAVSATSAELQPQCFGTGCNQNGLQLVTKFVRHYLEQQPADIQLGDGIHLVSSSDAQIARAVDDGGLLAGVENFLRSHELRIRLAAIMPNSENIGRTFSEVVNDITSRDIGVGRQRIKGGGGGKKGGGGLLLVALMMGKMMAAIGFGTVGLLAMKALMVSALALMLSTIIGLKKLFSSGHDEGGHTVIHATASGHEHRRRRDIASEMAYHAWTEYFKR